MKNHPFFSIVLALTLLIGKNGYGQDLTESSKELGLMSYLTTVKSMSEFKMITLATDSNYISNKEKSKDFQAEYNLLKISIDRFINQLVADMTVKNGLRHYKKINKYIKGDLSKLPKSMEPYKKSLEEIQVRFETFMLKSYSSMLEGPTIEDILGAVELTYGIIKDAREFREKKIVNLSSQLKELKLNSLKEITEAKKKE